jgi:chaperonin cofactor prefoldin
MTRKERLNAEIQRLRVIEQSVRERRQRLEAKLRVLLYKEPLEKRASSQSLSKGLC